MSALESAQENARLIGAFNRLGLNVVAHPGPSGFIAELELPSTSMQWNDVQKFGSFMDTDEHFRGYGETEEEAYAGLTKRFKMTSVNDECVVIRTSPAGRYLVVRSDGAEGVRNIGYLVTAGAESGSKVLKMGLTH